MIVHWVFSLHVSSYHYIAQSRPPGWALVGIPQKYTHETFLFEGATQTDLS